jgi:hypothetical protein
MNPIRYDNEIPVFTTRDIDDYGFPEIYGYEKYIVVESRELNLVTDYKMEQEREFKSIHRYSRLARFKSTLYQLLGERGQVAPQTYSIIQTYLKPTSQNKWNDTRKLLKHFKLKVTTKSQLFYINWDTVDHSIKYVETKSIQSSMTLNTYPINSNVQKKSIRAGISPISVTFVSNYWNSMDSRQSTLFHLFAPNVNVKH